MLQTAQNISHLLCCPRCRSPLTPGEARTFSCSDAACGLSSQPFADIDGQPVLLDFENSVLEEKNFRNRAGVSVQKRDPSRRKLRTKIEQALFGENSAAKKQAAKFLQDVRAINPSPIVLVVGGGEVGSGAGALYEDSAIRIIGTDTYLSENTTLVADGHHLPLCDQSVDGVWIQAVLEHVLDPAMVVAEIHRVLKPGGVVYADTPFMQQVHEGAYDFTRFTLSGHRWLFKNFSLIDAGYAGGPGASLIWAIRYFVRALTRNNKAANLAGFAFFWLRFFDAVMVNRWGADAASGVYFYGRRAAHAISPKDIIAFYNDQQGLIARGRA